MKKVLILFANGFEEIEAVTPFDLLTRAGLDVVSVGVEGKEVFGSRGLRIDTDRPADEIDEDFDALILPGGMPGATHLAESEAVRMLLGKAVNREVLIGALCASPGVVLGALGILNGKSFTCYPGFEEEVAGGRYLEQPVVIDGPIITGSGPGAAAEFSFAIIEALMGVETADAVRSGALF